MRQNMQTKLLTFVIGLAVVSLTLTAVADERGSLKGRFVVTGAPEKLKPLKIDKDPFCMGLNPPPENKTVVVGKNNALANVVVYLRAPLVGKIEVPADNEAAIKKAAVLDNRGCSFHPHILAVQVGQILSVTNSDPTGHNTNLSSFLGQNPIVPANGKVDLNVGVPKTVPQQVKCNIHPWMEAYVVPLPHPYVAISGNDGTFEIKNLPAGQHEFQFWHEAQGYMKNLKFKGGSTDPRVGRAKLTITAGKTLDLGDIKVSASVLVPRS